MARRLRPRAPRPPPPAAEGATTTQSATTTQGATATGGSAGPERIETYEGRALGSALRLQVRLAGPASGAGREVSDAAWDEVRAEFAAVDLALSRFRDDSELTALNRLAGTDQVITVSWRLREAIATIHRAGRITGGRFDGSVVDALERLGEHGAALARTRLDQDPPVSGTRAHVTLERPRRVRVPARPIDTGGIGKGLALRWAARRAGTALPDAACFLLDAGGDIVAAGEPPHDGWRIGIEDPAGDDDAEPLAVTVLPEGAISTSSVRVRNWTSPDGRAVHHLVDPRTRESARSGLIAVTVAGPDPAWAEVWTKALFLAGRAAIGGEARARGLAAWWVTDEGRLGMTPAARERSIWVAEDRVG